MSINRYDGQKNYVYYQEMIEGNSSDYRVTTIGSEIAFAFRRRNRANDFRASGSGLIDYDIEQNKEVIKYCLDISKKMRFDTMCYDILFKNDKFYLIEYSYTFNDKAIFNCPGHFFQKGGELKWQNRPCWPQELIIKMLLKMWGIKKI